MNNDLELRVKRPLKGMPLRDLLEIDSEAKAIREMVRGSGLQDKTLAIEISIDNAVMSKAQSGQARLSEEAMDALMDACGSEAWLLYWIARRGYDPSSLRRIESEIERENRLLREELDAIQREREVELRLFSKLRTA